MIPTLLRSRRGPGRAHVRCADIVHSQARSRPEEAHRLPRATLTLRGEAGLAETGLREAGPDQAEALRPAGSSQALSASMDTRTAWPSENIPSWRGSDTTHTIEPCSVSTSYSTVSP